jgi:signal transduction histidine kinase
MVRPEAETYSCAVQTSLAEKLPLVEVDPIQMQQVFMNLVTNAFHAMGNTPVAQRKVEMTTRLEENGAVLIAVRDYGTGVSAEMQERLFEHFYTTREDGLGMGLAIVRSFTDANNGEIIVRNAEGGGACFEIRLPSIGQPME